MWNRIELKEDSKLLVRLNYWPFVLVALIHGIVAGNGFELRRRFERAGHIWDDDYYYGYRYGFGYDDYQDALYEIARVILPFFGLAMVLVLGAWFIALMVRIFVANPLEVGCKRYMAMAREVKPQFSEMGFAFRSCYLNIVKTMFLRDLYIFLWTLLLVVPGIIKAYEYRMVPYLMAEYPDMASEEAFRISREMMLGNKSEAFVMDLSFLGWNFLSAVTFGLVGIFYSGPYQMLTNAALYLVLKRTNPSLGYAKPDTDYYL